MEFPPYCLDCEVMLTADEWYARPLCAACMQRMYDEACAEVAPAIERDLVEWHYIRWGRFWREDGWLWVHPMEFLDWCLGSQADTDPDTAYD